MIFCPTFHYHRIFQLLFDDFNRDLTHFADIYGGGQILSPRNERTCFMAIYFNAAKSSFIRSTCLGVKSAKIKRGECPSPALVLTLRHRAMSPPPALRCQLATGSKRKKPGEEIKEATTRGGEKPETGLQPRAVAAHFYFRPRRYYSCTGVLAWYPRRGSWGERGKVRKNSKRVKQLTREIL